MQIDKKTNGNTIYFPKNRTKDNDTLFFKIVLKQDYTNNTYEFKTIDEDCLLDYYKFTIDLADIPDGEYKYQIFQYVTYFDNGLKEEVEYCKNLEATGLIKICTKTITNTNYVNSDKIKPKYYV